MSPPAPPRAALLIAHPGHELRVHGWLEQTRPIVYVLTDGSGASGRPRLTTTARILERAGATVGPVFGRFTDRAFYDAVLAGAGALFRDLADELAEHLAVAKVALVAGDAAEGYNPAHDLCRHLADAVVTRLASRGHQLENWEFPLDAAPVGSVGASPALRLELGDATFARKLAAARGYPEMAAEVERAFAAHGPAAFRTEAFWRAGTFGGVGAPFYEQHGESRRAEGHYRTVLRYRDHVAPLAAALARAA